MLVGATKILSTQAGIGGNSPARLNASDGQNAQVSSKRSATPNWAESARHPTFKSNGQNHSAGQTVLSTPTTPTPQTAQSPRTPAHADKTRLARDVLRALGRPSGSFNTVTVPSTPAGTPSAPNLISAERSNAFVNQAEPIPPFGAAEDQTVPAAQHTEREVIVIDEDDASASETKAMANAIERQRDEDTAVIDTGGPPAVVATNREPSPMITTINSTINFPDATEIVEVSTPGALEMIYNEAQQALRIHAAPSRLRSHEEDAPLPNATSPPTSPLLGSVASPPPVSRLSTPIEDTRQDITAVDDFPMYQSVEGLSGQEEHRPHSPPRTPNAFVAQLPILSRNGGGDSEHGARPASLLVSPTISQFGEPSTPGPVPQAGPSKEPLFLSSPLSSSDSVINQILLPTDAASDSFDTFVPSGLLGVSTYQLSRSKGKGRARDSSSDEGRITENFTASSRPKKRRKVIPDDSSVEIVESSEPEEPLRQSQKTNARRRGFIMEVLVPHSERVERIKERIAALQGRSSTRHKSPRKAATKRRIVSDDSSEEGDDTRDGGNHISAWI